MIKCVIVADDLTGANASASLLKKIGLKAASLMVLDKLASVDLGNLDGIACSTDSRGISSQDAYNRVLAATKLFKDHQALVYNKRVDSTLRGNLGAEIDAMLDGLGDGRVAIVVPSFPDSNRIAIQGMLFVEGKLIDKMQRECEIQRIIEDVKRNVLDYNTICITSTVLEGDYKLPLDQIAQDSGKDIEAISKMISTGIAEITKELIIQDCGFEGVISSGGDITFAVCESVGAIGIEIKEEVVPLVAYGSLIGGKKDKFKIITKGGMIGGKDCFELCIDRIKKDI